MPSLKRYMTAELNFKASFNAYMRRRFGADAAEVIWRQIDDVIADVFLKNRQNLIQALDGFRHPENFFEMVRFDFIIAEARGSTSRQSQQQNPHSPLRQRQLTVYLMEVNMSPNLSSQHFPPNRRLYEQALFNLFALTGVNFGEYLLWDSDDISDREMIARRGDVAIDDGICADCVMTKTMASDDRRKLSLSSSSSSSCVCQRDNDQFNDRNKNNRENEVFATRLCAACLSDDLESTLRATLRERRHIGDMKMLLPSSRISEDDSDEDKLLKMWLKAKNLISG